MRLICAVSVMMTLITQRQAHSTAQRAAMVHTQRWWHSTHGRSGMAWGGSARRVEG